VTGSSQSTSTSDLLARLQTARKCTVRLVIVPLRKYITVDGLKGSPFSPDSAKAFTDRMAKVLVPDTLRKYDPWIIGFNLADDYGCASCWGGVTVTPAQIETWARYVRTKIPGLRLGVRADMAFVQKSSTLASAIDYAWAQYHTGKGDAKTYFDKHASLAKSVGVALAMGLNVKYCGGAGTAPCTPTQVRTFLGMAAKYPDNCALLGWTYSSTALEQTEMADAWDYVLKLAAQHRTCHASISDGVPAPSPCSGSWGSARARFTTTAPGAKGHSKEQALAKRDGHAIAFSMNSYGRRRPGPGRDLGLSGHGRQGHL
jgi:hypothetical protein